MFKKCKICGKLINRKALLGRGLSAWQRRVFCSVKCKGIGQGSKFNGRYKTSYPGLHKGIKHHFICHLCKMEIVGSKIDLKNHKYEVHGQ